jgi:hypothetical protein
MRTKTRIATTLLAIVGFAMLAGCIVAPGPGYYDGHRGHGYGHGYHDRGYWR